MGKSWSTCAHITGTLEMFQAQESRITQENMRAGTIHQHGQKRRGESRIYRPPIKTLKFGSSRSQESGVNLLKKNNCIEYQIIWTTRSDLILWGDQPKVSAQVRSNIRGAPLNRRPYTDLLSLESFQAIGLVALHEASLAVANYSKGREKFIYKLTHKLTFVGKGGLRQCLQDYQGE
ncbi:uncharacterized protein LOC127901292 isoform X2 [Citrus sinensis]|uniref:uncharacterized protein LOC127901292 isoform X2 n=1 Tax=Citrus sinensis TaxID=2711 RepID=UPI002278C694|nr:uncharacterized protein LOC127901292 isoform X2 [Citrus sinensis]